MLQNKTLINFIMDSKLLNRVEDFRFKNRFPTRAAAIKYLLDWALTQKPSVKNMPVATEEGDAPPEPSPVAAALASPMPDPPMPQRAPVPSRESMIQALRDQGYEVGDAVRHSDGRERILVRSRDRSAWVSEGPELQDLAAGRASLSELSAKRAAGG